MQQMRMRSRRASGERAGRVGRPRPAGRHLELCGFVHLPSARSAAVNPQGLRVSVRCNTGPISRPFGVSRSLFFSGRSPSHLSPPRAVIITPPFFCTFRPNEEEGIDPPHRARICGKNDVTRVGRRRLPTTFAATAAAQLHSKPRERTTC